MEIKDGESSTLKTCAPSKTKIHTYSIYIYYKQVSVPPTQQEPFAACTHLPCFCCSPNQLQQHSERKGATERRGNAQATGLRATTAATACHSLSKLGLKKKACGAPSTLKDVSLVILATFDCDSCCCSSTSLGAC